MWCKRWEDEEEALRIERRTNDACPFTHPAIVLAGEGLGLLTSSQLQWLPTYLCCPDENPTNRTRQWLTHTKWDSANPPWQFILCSWRSTRIVYALDMGCRKANSAYATCRTTHKHQNDCEGRGYCIFWVEYFLLYTNKIHEIMTFFYFFILFYFWEGQGLTI